MVFAITLHGLQGQGVLCLRRLVDLCWLTGLKPSLLDLVIWPWFERFLAFALIDKQLAVSSERHPRLMAWQATMARLPAVKQCAIDLEAHAVYLRSCADKSPNYSYGLE